jgi:hypothetical protein
MARKKVNKWGKLAFILGIILAILAGAVSVFITGESTLFTNGLIPLVLVLLGLVVGFLNIQEKEQASFLIATIALMAVGTAGVETIAFLGLGELFKAMVLYITIFVAPAAVVVSLKLVLDLARD